MKKYLKEIISLIIQVVIFYVLPISIWNSDNIIGCILLMILLTFIISLILGVISNNKLKFLYPVVIAILFIPSVFIYYNETALVHSIWYLIVSLIGLAIGSLINKTHHE